MKKYIGAIDQGTTSTRFIIFDASGRIISSHQQEHRQIYPKPGWVEHDAEEIWRNTRLVIEEAIRKAGLHSKDLAAIGITNQRETTVVWDRSSGKPFCHAIVWQDTRTADLCAALSAQGGQDRFRQKTGLPISTYFSGPKIMWILQNVPAARKAADRGEALFGTIDAFLLWQLTGGAVHTTDVTNASRTLLMDLQGLKWDPEILEELALPQSLLPEIKPSSHIFAAAVKPEIIAGVPIAGIMGDQQSALVGQTCFSPGQAKNTYGTGCFMLLNTGETPKQSRHGLVTTVGYQWEDKPPIYALEGSVAIAGALVQWLRDNLGLIRTSDEIEALAASVPDSGGIYFVPAFSGLYAPHWRSDARGVIAGLTRYIDKGHLARAVLEATAFQTREILDAMIHDAEMELRELRVNGGMVKNELLMQFQTDVLGVPVVRPQITETTALGAAYAAGLAVGYWQDTTELQRHWRVDKTWRARMDAATRDSRYAQWRKAVSRTLDWVE
ncbi:glycerol kinase GlpK [candidate division KSB1 bacterium]|nr:glycerol kinase GlpK [candidate division KSB1 bacterium]